MTALIFIYGLVALLLFGVGNVIYWENIHKLQTWAAYKNEKARWARIGKRMIQFSLIWPLVLPYFAWVQGKHLNAYRLRGEKQIARYLGEAD